MIVVLMGVSGAGKTTIGKLLAARLGMTFADADDFHSQSNREKMAAGHALNDEDRKPWLLDLNRLLRGWSMRDAGGVLACSALKETYREVLAVGMPQGALHFVLLEVPPDELAMRLAHRTHAFMNPALLQSQVATLELPHDAVMVINDKLPADVVEEIVRQFENQGV